MVKILSNQEKLVDQNVDLWGNLLVLIKGIYLELFSYVELRGMSTNEMSNKVEGTVLQ